MTRTPVLFLLSMLFISFSLAAQDSTRTAVHKIELTAGDLTAVITDNTAWEGHRQGYNGVAYLSHRADPGDHFEKPVAGLNFEHIFDGAKWWAPTQALFEPRWSEMVLARLSDNSVQLHMPPSDLHKLESWTKFTLTAPHYLDMDFFCIPRKATFDYGYIGMFWASYIQNSNEDEKPIYYIGRPRSEAGKRWIRYMTPEHSKSGTVRYEFDTFDLTFTPGFTKMLYNTFSDSVYCYPFYYGRRGLMVHIIMFDSPGPIRFSHSPTSGSPVGPGTLPAWDFQFIVPEYEVGKSYGYKARLVYKPWVSQQDVIDEYERWSGRKVELER